MAGKIALLRGALQHLLDAAFEQAAPHSPEVTKACAAAVIALHGTRFVPPDRFPVIVGTRCGALVTLFALHEGVLIGAFRDTENGGLDLRHWNADGTMFGRSDPDHLDLVVPDDDDDLAPAAERAARGGCVVIPFMGRVS